MILRRSFRLLMCIAIVAAIAMMNWYCSSSKKVESPLTTYAGLSDTARYVGMETCKGCHSNIHETYTHTGMGKSFDLASHAKSSGKFEGHPVVYDKFKDFYYSPLWEKDSLKFMEFRLDGKDTVHKRIETIKYIVGSGQHTNSHMWSSNGFLFQAPLTFYTQKGQWDLPPGFEDGNNTRFNRMIGVECMSCHNGYPEFELGSENKYNLVKQGIDCERCHGPGSVHVQLKSTGVYVDTSKYIDYSIVNPAKLAVNLQLDVCQRCHVQGNAVLNEGKSFLDFKPGMALSDVMNVFMPVYKGREQEHIMASHAERLKMSKCFISTIEKIEKNPASTNLALKPYKNALTCVTCHNPHISVRVTGDKVFNAACTNCHQSGKETLCTNDPHLNTKAGNNCVSCHMAFNGASDIPHVSVHDHKISIPGKTTLPAATKIFSGISCINNPNPPVEAKAQAYINYFEKFGLGIAMLDSAERYIPSGNNVDITKNIGRLIQLYYLKNDFSKVIQYVEQVKNLSDKLNHQQFDNYPAWTCYRIAESYNSLGNTTAALPWFSQANRLAPFYPDFSNKYASALAASENIAQAKELYLDLVKTHPEYAPGFSNLGYLLLSTEQNAKAAEVYYDRALYLDPDYEPALLNKAGLFVVLNRREDAIKILKQILRKNPANVQASTAYRQLTRNS